MRAWYDILQLGGGAEDEAGHPRLAGAARSADRAGRRSAASRRDSIVLAGFSQGGAIALQTGLRHPERLAGDHGAVDLSAAGGRRSQPSAAAANRDLPIFMAHGTLRPDDPDARAPRNRATRCEALGYAVGVARIPDAALGVPARRSRDIAAFLLRIL